MRLNDGKLWLWLATSGMLLNLFNLIPVAPLDGGRIATLLGRGFWWFGLVTLVFLSFLIQDGVLILFAVFGLLEINSRFTRLPRWVFLLPAVLALIHGLYFEFYIAGPILSAVCLLLAYGNLRSDVNRSEPRQEDTFFEVSTVDKVVLLSAYFLLIVVLGATFWCLAGNFVQVT